MFNLSIAWIELFWAAQPSSICFPGEILAFLKSAFSQEFFPCFQQSLGFNHLFFTPCKKKKVKQNVDEGEKISFLSKAWEILSPRSRGLQQGSEQSWLGRFQGGFVSAPIRMVMQPCTEFHDISDELCCSSQWEGPQLQGHTAKLSHKKWHQSLLVPANL